MSNASFPLLINWLSDYDNENMTIEQVVQNLTDLGQYQNFANWFVFFFGQDGLIVSNFTAANASMANMTSNETVSNETVAVSNETVAVSNETVAVSDEALANATEGDSSSSESTSSSSISGRRLQQGSTRGNAGSLISSAPQALISGMTEVPAGLENLVNLIQQLVDQEFNSLNIAQYLQVTGQIASPPIINATNNTAAPSGGAVIPGVIVAPADLFNVSQFVPSNTCQLNVDDSSNVNNDTVCCNNPAIGANGTSFCGSLSSIGNLWVLDVDSLCGNLSLNNQTCMQNAVEGISSADCVSNATWQWAVANNAQFLYAFLQNHNVGIQDLFNYCSANQANSFGGLAESDLGSQFMFDFGSLGNLTFAAITPVAESSTSPDAGASDSGISR